MSASVGWQSDLDVCKRNLYMLENELETDVVFQVSSPQEPMNIERVCAHRYMLISASPVFWAMLCGELREPGDIAVPDVEPDAFREMLRFIYTDKASINGFNVMQILHAAKKYQLSLLIQRCIDFLDYELNASNASSILDHCRFFDEKQLASKCLDFIERNTAEALQSDEFMSVSQETLGVILDSNHLAMKEVDIFKKTMAWASSKSDETVSCREVLGDNVYKIRFPAMSFEEFKEDVIPTHILEKREQQQVLKYLANPDVCLAPVAFCCEPRKPKQELPMRKGDRVRLMQGGKYDSVRLRTGQRGTFMSGPEDEKYEKKIVEFDNGWTLSIPVGNIQRIF